jgi:7-cyano-7-deazaguanine synthase in queuosine biosynthesis
MVSDTRSSSTRHGASPGRSGGGASGSGNRPGQFGGSALTADIPVPVHRTPDQMAGEIPVTYVPARNTVFLSLALAWAEVLGATDIFLGVNAIDYSGYPDCRPEFLAAFERMARLATRAGVGGADITIHAPSSSSPRRRSSVAGSSSAWTTA